MRVCLATTPATARAVLVDDRERYQKAEIVRDRLGTLQGDSLVLLEGDAWRERRRTLRGGFTPDRVASAGTLTTQYASETVASWPDGGVVPVVETARDLSLALLARSLFGLDLRGGGTPIHRAADDVLARLQLDSASTYLPEWVPTPTNRRFRRAVATLHDRIDEVVAERTRESAGDDLSSESDEEPDLLSTMAAAGLPVTEIRDELIALLFAGFDSTATALACTLGLLAEHPEVQSRLRDELDAVVGGGPSLTGAEEAQTDESDLQTRDGDTALTPADLDELPYLDAVVRESLRLYPPQYLLFREPTQRVTLGGYDIDAGTTVVVPPWVLHRDPASWDEPTAFRPSRWLDDDGSVVTDTHPEYAYLPYGAGPRGCLGRRLADQTLRLIVAVVCRRRRLDAVDSLSVSAGPTLSLDDGLDVRVYGRE